MWCSLTEVHSSPVETQGRALHFTFLAVPVMIGVLLRCQNTHTCSRTGHDPLVLVSTWLQWADLWVTGSFDSCHLDDVQVCRFTFGSSLFYCFLLILFSGVFYSLFLWECFSTQYVWGFILTFASSSEWKLSFFKPGNKNMHMNALVQSVNIRLCIRYH